jgi:hypothetical protein
VSGFLAGRAADFDIRHRHAGGIATAGAGIEQNRRLSGAKKSRITKIKRMEHHIGGGVYWITIQLGDDPMNLPLELQRRLDRRWSSRFGRSEQGSRPGPCAAMIGAKSRNFAGAISHDGPSRETPTKSPPASTRNSYPR